jgi:ABC-type Fe3+-siderophore transport system permease subunit
MNTEPAVTIGSIVALVGAVLTLLVVFGVEITDAQQKAIIAVVTVGGPILAGLLIRRKVTPVE